VLLPKWQSQANFLNIQNLNHVFPEAMIDCLREFLLQIMCAKKLFHKACDAKRNFSSSMLALPAAMFQNNKTDN
jgi:hypothetical protein